MTPPWCQGSLLAGPSSGWLPAGAGVCLLAACVRLLCSALLLPGSWGSCAAPGSLWGDPKLWHPPGSGWEQGTVVPVLGSCHGRRQGCSGTGVLCPTEPRLPCLPCQPAQGCCDGGLGTPGSPPGPLWPSVLGDGHLDPPTGRWEVTGGTGVTRTHPTPALC